MAPSAIFSICNALALTGWIILIAFPMWHSSDKVIIGILITLFAVVYTWMLVSQFNFSDAKKFNSLAGVVSLFSDPGLVLAGWVHYLAFDLLAGVFIKKNSFMHGISHWLVIPCMILTFMFGPIGLLLYLLIRTIKSRQYFADNFAS